MFGGHISPSSLSSLLSVYNASQNGSQLLQGGGSGVPEQVEALRQEALMADRSARLLFNAVSVS